MFILLFLSFTLLIFFLANFSFLGSISLYIAKINLFSLFLYSLFLSCFLIGLFMALEFFDQAFLTRFFNYLLGIFYFMILMSLFLNLIYFLVKNQNLNLIFIGLMSLGVFLALFSIYNFHKEIKVEKIIIETEKVKENYKFVMLADTQYGSTSLNHLNEVMRKTYNLSPDFIVFVGDLVDFNSFQEDDFKVFDESKVDIYFSRGNHEFYHRPSDLLKYLKARAKIKLLLNQKTNFNELEIIGIDYARDEKQLERELSQIKTEEEKFKILLFHDPKYLDYAVSQKIDLILSGHTHAGQIWPFTWLTDWLYKYGNGLFKEKESTIYTTDGAGLWGPLMRLGTQNEIVLFEIKAQ